jgi:hypothetical protein
MPMSEFAEGFIAGIGSIVFAVVILWTMALICFGRDD